MATVRAADPGARESVDNSLASGGESHRHPDAGHDWSIDLWTVPAEAAHDAARARKASRCWRVMMRRRPTLM